MPVHEFPTDGFLGDTIWPGRTIGATTRWLLLRRTAVTRPAREPGAQVSEFKQMVRALHQAGIEVILDVVFNHTAEGNEHGPTLSFKGLENRVYYMLGNGGSYYRNYSGCGNTVNGNHPIVREMIFLCLRHWVHNYHVDGFRFDLASILSRDRNGESGAQSAGGRGDRRRPAVGRHARSSPRPGTRPGRTRSARSASCAGPSGTAAIATTCGASGAAIRSMTGAAGHAAGRLERPVPGRRPASVSQHQLHHLARRLSAQRPGELQPQAQRGQRRRQPRRRQQQLQRQLRRRRPDAPPRDRATAAAADQEHAGHAAAEPGRADDALRRRMPPHAARQQQRLLPGQRDQLVRLEAGGEERRPGAVRAGA